MFKKLFGKEEASKSVEIVAPITGKYVNIAEIPDPVFAQKMMGEGFGIEPAEGMVVAPFDGEIINVFPTKHAIGIKHASGLEVLIHVGLETVAMNGEGFKAHVAAGDKVKKGDELLEFDIARINQEASSTISPVIITNSDAVEKFDFLMTGDLDRGNSVVAKVEMK